MEEKIKVDESLLDQMVNEFILDEILLQYEMKYTEVYFDYTKFDFYLKAKDLLRPCHAHYGQNYEFNTHIFLTLSMTNVVHAFQKGKVEFYKFLKTELDKSEVYNAYFRRLFT